MFSRKTSALVLSFAVFASLSCFGQGSTYFVSTAGSDDNPGTQAAPFRTIQHAAEAAMPGDTVRVAAGMYQEAVTFPRSGEPDAPIVFEGERGPDGEWLTILDRSTPAEGWEPAPEIGEGVFKAELGFNPGCLTRDGKTLARIHDRHMARERDDMRSGFNLLAMPPDEPLHGSERMESSVAGGAAFWINQYIVEEHKFWEGLRAIYGYLDGVTYIRFRHGEDPREMELLAAPEGAGFVLRDRGHIVIRDFLVRGAMISVQITGEEAVGNVVEDCRLTHGRRRVELSNGAARNVIRNNEMTMAYYGHDSPGAWGTNDPTMATSKNYYVYRTFKNLLGTGSTDENGVLITRGGEANEVAGNRIYGGLAGITVRQAPRLRVHHNVIHGMSSIGIITIHNGGYGPLDAEFHDNLVYDCNINLRIHRYNESRAGERREYYYRNRFHVREGVGSNIFVHWTQTGGGGREMEEHADHPEVFLYHNSFSGGRQGLRPGLSHRYGGLANTRLINNVFSSSTPWRSNRNFYDDPDMIDVADFNWLGGELHVGVRPKWLGENNIVADGERIWPIGELPDFRLPEGHAARNAGIDLSRPFTVQGKAFDPLPGMAQGYFQGERPDIGAVQHGAED